MDGHKHMEMMGEETAEREETNKKNLQREDKADCFSVSCHFISGS